MVRSEEPAHLKSIGFDHDVVVLPSKPVRPVEEWVGIALGFDVEGVYWSAHGDFSPANLGSFCKTRRLVEPAAFHLRGERIRSPAVSYTPKTVWVLGSGFSRSLGGPLLKELIGYKAQQETHAVFPRIGPRALVYRLFTDQKDKLWEHAEDFLDFIDTAMLPQSPRYQILQNCARIAMMSLNEDPDSFSAGALHRLATLTVAAECSTYTENCDVRSEAWGPYVDWAIKLGERDTVVTFNYDLVLEKLGTAEYVRGIGESTVAFPKADGSIRLLSGAGICPILKLHGSADWVCHANAENRRLSRLEDLADAEDYSLLIATPGTAKSKHVNKVFRVIWQNALDAITAADVVVFMGYRFPPSDSEARGKLLGALRKNKQPFVKVHTVLGPNLHEPDSVRLVALLQHTLRSAGRYPVADLPRFIHMTKKPAMFEVVAQPLYAQDFMTVMHPAEMFDEKMMQLCSAIP